MSITDSILTSVLLQILCHNSDNKYKQNTKPNFILPGLGVFCGLCFLECLGFGLWFVLLWFGFGGFFWVLGLVLVFFFGQ